MPPAIARMPTSVLKMHHRCPQNEQAMPRNRRARGGRR